MSRFKTEGAGKGDDPRPVNKNRFDKHFDDINWSKGRKCDKKCKDCKCEHEKN